jgi:hypothetical protein
MRLCTSVLPSLASASPQRVLIVAATARRASRMSHLSRVGSVAARITGSRARTGAVSTNQALLSAGAEIGRRASQLINKCAVRKPLVAHRMLCTAVGFPKAPEVPGGRGCYLFHICRSAKRWLTKRWHHDPSRRPARPDALLAPRASPPAHRCPARPRRTGPTPAPPASRLCVTPTPSCVGRTLPAAGPLPPLSTKQILPAPHSVPGRAEPRPSLRPPAAPFPKSATLSGHG